MADGCHLHNDAPHRGRGNNDPMGVFDWKAEYSVGDAELDRDHCELFERAGALHRAMLSGQASSLLEGLLKSLTEYTETHFAREEKWMAEAAYPESERHRGEHNSFRLTIGRMSLKQKRADRSTSVELIQYLGNWLRIHILESDRKIAACRAGGTPAASKFAPVTTPPFGRPTTGRPG